jgi:deoxyribonuclease IV
MENRKYSLLGAHVSVAGGYHLGIDRAEALGAECMQIFGASPRQWAAPLPTADAARLFKERLKASTIKDVYLHAAYLPNLASPEAATIKKSIESLSVHLKIAQLLGATGLIFHVGSGKEAPKPEAVKRSVEAMKQIFKNVPGDTYLVMENSASHKKVGDTPAELGLLHERVGSPRLKVCIDTAHAFESGNIPEYAPEYIKKFFDECDQAFGIENLVALHANDSKTAAGSNNDKHENIGKGFIGEAGFRQLAQEKRLSNMSIFLEVPGFNPDEKGPDKPNMDMLKKCFGRG